VEPRVLAVQQERAVVAANCGVNNMKVNFFATLRQVTGQKTLEFDLPAGVTAQGVLDEVVRRYPAMIGMLADEDGKLLGHCHMFINGRGVTYLLDEMNSVVNDSDVVNFFPAVGGGDEFGMDKTDGHGSEAHIWP